MENIKLEWKGKPIRIWRNGQEQFYSKHTIRKIMEFRKLIKNKGKRLIPKMSLIG
jgi:hypothetical protein